MSLSRFRIWIAFALLFLIFALARFNPLTNVFYKSYEAVTRTSSVEIFNLLINLNFFIFVFCVTYASWRRVLTVRISQVWALMTLFMSLTTFGLITNIPMFGLEVFSYAGFSYFWLIASILFLFFYDPSDSSRKDVKSIKMAWFVVYSASLWLIWRTLEQLSELFVVLPGGYNNVISIKQFMKPLEMLKLMPEYILHIPLNVILAIFVISGLLFVYFRTKQSYQA